jgi:predicted GIY-YIG superfamily endonuclease
MAKPIFVYLLHCSDGSYYTGQTDNLEHRIASHQSGGVASYTQKRLPVELVFSETFESRIDALERERQIKGWSRAKKEALIAADWNRISALAKSNR